MLKFKVQKYDSKRTNVSKLHRQLLWTLPDNMLVTTLCTVSIYKITWPSSLNVPLGGSGTSVLEVVLLVPDVELCFSSSLGLAGSSASSRGGLEL